MHIKFVGETNIPLKEFIEEGVKKNFEKSEENYLVSSFFLEDYFETNPEEKKTFEELVNYLEDYLVKDGNNKGKIEGRLNDIYMFVLDKSVNNIVKELEENNNYESSLLNKYKQHFGHDCVKDFESFTESVQESLLICIESEEEEEEKENKELKS